MFFYCMIFWFFRYINCLLDLEMYGVWGYLFVEVLKSFEKIILVFKDY